MLSRKVKTGTILATACNWNSSRWLLSKQILLDVGPIVSLLYDQDEWHGRCEAFFGKAIFK